MNNSNLIDLEKRNTLKVFAGISAVGLLASSQVLADTSINNDGTAIDCTLIYRADGLRLHLLMQNRTNAEVTAKRFNTQPILIGNTLFDLANAYVEPVVIPAMDRVMIRLNIDTGTQTGLADSKAISMDAATEYLSQGTRVVKFNAIIKHSVGTISTTPPRKILT